MTEAVYQPCCRLLGTVLPFILCVTTLAIF